MDMLVLADDFTGALDTGIQFAKYGAGTKVIADPDYDFGTAEDARILVIDTETRHQTKEKAAEVVGKIVRRAAAAGVRYFYKKTDSALRGNAGAEMEALLTASGGARIHFIPAFPAMNRTVEDGVLYIDHVPVADSVFGRDPFDPVPCSGVAEILGRQTALQVTVSDRIRTDVDGIIVYNSRTPEDIRALVSDLEPSDGILLMAGCAGLASCMGSEENNNFTYRRREDYSEYTGLLVVCGSVNNVTKQQLEQARAAGFGYIRLDNHRKLTGWIRTAEGKAALAEWEKQCRADGDFLIDTNDSPEEESAAAWGRRHGMEVLQTGDRVADTLAYIVRGFLDSGIPKLLLLTGGDVLYHAMKEMGVRELTPMAEVEPGVILAEFRYRGKSCRVLTKSGGFGTENVMPRLAEQIRGGAEYMENAH